MMVCVSSSTTAAVGELVEPLVGVCLVLQSCVLILDKLNAKVRNVFIEVQEHTRPFNLASSEVQG